MTQKYVPIQSCTCTCQVHMLETQICTHSRLHLHTPNVCESKASDLDGQLSPISAKETAKVSPPVPCKCRVPHVPKPRSIFKRGVGGHCLTVHPRACTLKLYTLTNAPSLSIKAMRSVSPTSPCPATIMQCLKHNFQS